MSTVVYLRPSAPVSEHFVIEEKARDSWWVRSQPLAWDGTPLPNDRVVFFARSGAEARAWVDAQLPETAPLAVMQG